MSGFSFNFGTLGWDPSLICHCRRASPNVVEVNMISVEGIWLSLTSTVQLYNPSIYLLLLGCLIPIINTTFIDLSTTAYLFTRFSTSCPKTQPLESLVEERPESNHLQFLSPIYWKIKLPLRATTLLPTPRMAMRQCSSTSIPGSRYSRVDKNGTPLGKCGLIVLLPIDRANRRITRQPSGERIRIVSSVSQT